MKTFRNLVVRGTRPQIERIVERLAAAAEAWPRDHDAERKLGDSRYVCILAPARGSRPRAKIWLIRKESGELELANIIPVDSNSLSYDTYNEIVSDFIQEVIQPIAGETGAAVSVTADTLDVREKLSNEAARLLMSFSHIANRSGLHPLDRNRWLQFIIAAHKERAPLSATELKRWLVEDDGWPEDAACDLAIEYEQERELLDLYSRESIGA